MHSRGSRDLKPGGAAKFPVGRCNRSRPSCEFTHRDGLEATMSKPIGPQRGCRQRRNIMTTFLRSTLFVAALVIGANGLMAAQAGTNNVSLKQLVKQTKALEVTAETPLQHKALAAEYRQLAQRQFEESSKHAEIAAPAAQ